MIDELTPTIATSHGTQGLAVTIRDIQPSDADAHARFLSLVSAEDIRMRVFAPRHELQNGELERLTSVDKQHEIALIATRHQSPHEEAETLGAVRASILDGGASAEFAVLVRTDVQKMGLGHRLMTALMDRLRARGIKRLTGHVLRDNAAMKHLAHSLGFSAVPLADENLVLALELTLS
jgi:acetyltransferase